ncbi:MAG: glutathione peroxidase [Candidatus Gracilibacteria bacterium]|nr:glutathione peroxidase [Candidatus Gracilibacteria bacterium]
MNIYDFTVTTSSGEKLPLSQFRGQVILVVNVATKCGLSPQYRELQELYTIYQKDGLVILGFPCNQFAEQEPGSNTEIQESCQRNFGVTFPIMAKIDVNGPTADPLYQYLKGQKGGLFGQAIKWNFTKFLVDSSGNIVHRYAPTTTPKKIESAIKKLLNIE